MSIKAVNWALHCARNYGMPRGVAHCLLVLGMCHKARGNTCIVSYAELSSITGLSERKVAECIRTATELGFIKSEYADLDVFRGAKSFTLFGKPNQAGRVQA